MIVPPMERALVLAPATVTPDGMVLLIVTLLNATLSMTVPLMAHVLVLTPAAVTQDGTVILNVTRLNVTV